MKLTCSQHSRSTPPATDDAFGVGAQDDLEQHPRRVGRGAGIVVMVTTVKARQVEVVIEQVMDGMGETAG